MAFGIIQNFIAIPQPGTSNLPFPANKLPAFVPVVCTVTDEYGIAVAKLTTAMEENAAVVDAAFALFTLRLGMFGAPDTILPILQEINATLTRIADLRKDYSSKLTEISIALGTVSTAIDQHTVISSVTAANKIKTNNFYMAVSNENPSLPPLVDQLKEAGKDGIILSNSSGSVSLVNNILTSGTKTIVNWIAGTAIYKGVSNWIKSTVSRIAAPVIPSPESVKSKLQTGVVE